VPISTNGKVCGVLNLDAKRANAFDENDIDRARVVSGFIGLAIDGIPEDQAK
jgi:putative methionine-R-sulfoxide reductase with GAF domain